MPFPEKKGEELQSNPGSFNLSRIDTRGMILDDFRSDLLDSYLIGSRTPFMAWNHSL